MAPLKNRKMTCCFTLLHLNFNVKFNGFGKNRGVHFAPGVHYAPNPPIPFFFERVQWKYTAVVMATLHCFSLACFDESSVSHWRKW